MLLIYIEFPTVLMTLALIVNLYYIAMFTTTYYSMRDYYLQFTVK